MTMETVGTKLAGGIFTYKRSSAPWLGLLGGCMLMGRSLFAFFLLDDGTILNEAYIPVWTDWLLLSMGIVIIAFSIYDLIRNKNKERNCAKTCMDEKPNESKTKIDSM